MNDLGLVVLEALSAILAFVLVRFMMRPYEYTRERQYLGLPLGFACLGVSYIFMGGSLLSDNHLVIEELKWLQLLTGSFAFAFLATSYYFSGKVLRRNVDIILQALLSLLILGLIISCLIVFVPPAFDLPNYKTVDEYFRVFNMILALYITLHTLRHHASKPNPKTIIVPLAYATLAFSQYSFLIWSLDASFSAFVGAHVMRLFALLIFLFVSYRAFLASETTAEKNSGGR